jgi:hypothetical protein
MAALTMGCHAKAWHKKSGPAESPMSSMTRRTAVETVGGGRPARSDMCRTVACFCDGGVFCFLGNFLNVTPALGAIGVHFSWEKF